MTADNALRLVSASGWVLILLVLLIPPCWRLSRRRARYLDPFWGVVMLGVLNRLMFNWGIDRTIAYAAAILMEALLAAAIWSYQRADR